MAKVKTIDDTNYWQECRDTITLTTDGELIAAIIGNFFFNLLNICIVNKPVFPLESLYFITMEIHAHMPQKMYKMLIEVLFIIVKIENNPISINSRIKK